MAIRTITKLRMIGFSEGPVRCPPYKNKLCKDRTSVA